MNKIRKQKLIHSTFASGRAVPDVFVKNIVGSEVILKEKQC